MHPMMFAIYIGKPKHRLIQNLGVMSEVDAERMGLILKAQQDPDLVLAKASDIVVTKHWLFLPIILLHSLWEAYKLHHFFPDGLLIEAMVLREQYYRHCLAPPAYRMITLCTENWISLTSRQTLYKPISILSFSVLILM